MWEVGMESDVSMDVLNPLLSGLSARLHPLVDPTRSSALAGTEHIILPGDGPLLVLITNRRLPHFTHDGFIQYWLDYHGPFAREHTPPRSEEHTSELQSLMRISYAVLCLKKKKTNVHTL